MGEVRLLPRAPAGATTRASTLSSAVPSRDEAHLVVDAVFADRAGAQAFEAELRSQGCSVDVRYRDMNGEQPGRTQVTLQHEETSGWRFREVKLHHAEEVAAYATLPRSVTVSLGQAAERNEAQPITPHGGSNPEEPPSD